MAFTNLSPVQRVTRVELKMIAAMVKDWCFNNEKLIYNQKLCTAEEVIRFVTPVLTEFYPKEASKNGVAKSGYFLMYEIYNDLEEFHVTCTVSYKGFGDDKLKECQALLNYFGIDPERPASRKDCTYHLKTWNYSETAGNSIDILHAVDNFVDNEMPVFEASLKSFFNKDSKMDVKEIKENNAFSGAANEALMAIAADKYENADGARKACLEANGTVCKICGFDYAKEYGISFTSCMEVHHTVPVYMMKEDYVLDPVKDLIPVCPNCHRLIHSKKDGVYSVDEVLNLKN